MAHYQVSSGFLALLVLSATVDVEGEDSANAAETADDDQNIFGGVPGFDVRSFGYQGGFGYGQGYQPGIYWPQGLPNGRYGPGYPARNELRHQDRQNRHDQLHSQIADAKAAVRAAAKPIAPSFANRIGVEDSEDDSTVDDSGPISKSATAQGPGGSFSSSKIGRDADGKRTVQVESGGFK